MKIQSNNTSMESPSISQRESLSVQSNQSNIYNPTKTKEESQFQANKIKQIMAKTLSYLKCVIVLISLVLILLFYSYFLSSQKKPLINFMGTKSKISSKQNNFTLKIDNQQDQAQYNSKHKHQNLTFQYPTVGIPVPGTHYNSTKVKIEDLAMFDQTVNQLFKPYNDTNCQYERIGDAQDGGYVLCKNFIHNSEALLNFGVEGRDQFGCHLTSKYTKIWNYQYDCTNPQQPLCITNENKNVFSSICVGEISEMTLRKTFYSFEDIIKSRDLKGKRITLKIDVEGGQYLGFKYLPMEYLDNIDQIVMELHFGQISGQQWGFLDMFRSLTDKFVSVNYHFNNNSCFRNGRILKSSAFEVTLVNKRLIKKKSNSQSYTEHPLNKRNTDAFIDCQMPQ